MPDTASLPLNQATIAIDHIVIEVGHAVGAEKFYEALLGFAPAGRDRWPVAGGGRSATLKAPSGQHLVLAEATPRNDLQVSAAHQAYRLTPEMRDRAAAAHQVGLKTWREDRPAEEAHRCYLEDPWGNRIQLVASSERAPGIDHVALETNNILWAREFYGNALGRPIEHRVGWKTQDYLAAKSRGEAAMAEAMPGARYWNERYSKFETERKSLRPNVQLYFTLGSGTSLAVYLANRLYQAPPDDAASGTPLLGLGVAADTLPALAAALSSNGVVISGPVDGALQVRDPGGNFLSFVVPRSG